MSDVRLNSIKCALATAQYLALSTLRNLKPINE